MSEAPRINEFGRAACDLCGTSVLPENWPNHLLGQQHERKAARVQARGAVDLTEARRLEAAATPPPGTRLVLMSEDLPKLMEAGTATGRRITVEWGEPDENGWYEPTFTSHEDRVYFDAVEQRDQLREALYECLTALASLSEGPGDTEFARGLKQAAANHAMAEAREALRRLQGEAAR